MNIIITGAQGQLGQDCCRVLGVGHAIYPLGSQELDIANADLVSKTIQTIRPDIVINCAAYTAVDNCETDKENCWRVNADAAGILATACNSSGARLFHISTDYVFDGKKPVPQAYTEEEQINPVSQYGASKLAGEEQVRSNLKDHVILRTAWLYGMGGPNFLKTMLRLAVTDPARTIRVVNDQFGSLTWTYRLALQIKALLPTNITGTLHATAEGHTTWFEGAKLFLESIDVPFTLEPCSTEDYPTPAERPRNSILENNLLKIKGLNRMVPWQDDVVAFARQFKSELLAGVR